jgi:hypothetical protein
MGIMGVMGIMGLVGFFGMVAMQIIQHVLPQHLATFLPWLPGPVK